MVSTASRVVIVGAGHAGGTLAAQLRQFGFAGSVNVIGAEPQRPYQRPPLSKGYLLGKTTFDHVALRPLDFFAQHDIGLHGNQKIVSLEPKARRVLTADGKHWDYDHLVLATGMRAIALTAPGAQLHGIYSLRSVNDADALRNALLPGKRLVIIGGGYIGLEVAASARSLGVEVTVLERAPQLLARSGSPEISAFLQAHHETHGVRFHFDAAVTALQGEHNDVRAVRLQDGTQIAADVVLVGVGATPESDLAKQAGLAVDGGVVVDDHCRTSDASIFAIGDVTNRPIVSLHCRARLESVQNAAEQARVVASVLTERPLPAGEVPWNWSDQYALKLQFAGLISGADHRVVRGSVEQAVFTVFHLRHGIMRAAEAVNSPAEFMAARKLIATGLQVDLQKLADPAVQLRDLVGQVVS
jgi:3-phenylpropionate/trans-cinnamate dioxygenase ferredoxin reductase component